ncbi:unnamed protein product, partial [Mesorhabditis belari]|uniref:Uncharacterized protein n=1 Tax=Mesorhabditis belari TaxID=2138241 RepID=A0AAF3F0F4_9BILA
MGVLFFYLMFTSSLLNAISRFPFYILAPLIACLSLLSTVFAGQTMAMLPVFFVFLASLTAGCGIFVYYGLEEVAYFNEILSFQFSFQKCLASLCVGFFLSFYQLAASPTMYQIFFSLSTRHKLRICLSLYSAFSLFFSSFVFIIVSIFTHFMEKHCKLPYSSASLLEFIKFTVPRSPFLSFFVGVSLVLLLMFTYQWTFIALVSTLWEEFLKNRFKEWSTLQQLCALQATALKVTITLILLSLIIGLSPISYATYLPIAFYIILTLASLTTACFACGYFLPFTNYRGCFIAFALCSALAVSIFSTNLTKNSVPKLQNNCTSFFLLNDGVESTSLHGNGFFETFARFPLEFLPITIILTFISICILISGLSGWQDLFAIDWNLIVWPCCLSNSLSANSYRKRRPFVESDSFRYAQNGDETMNEKGIK